MYGIVPYRGDFPTSCGRAWDRRKGLKYQFNLINKISKIQILNLI